MKRFSLAFLAFLMALTGLASAQERGGGGGGRSESVSPRLQSMGVRSVPRSFTNRSQLFSTSSRNFSLPSRGPNGGTFRASVVSPRAMNSSLVRNNMATVNGVGFRSQIRGFNARENVVGQYYWHNYNGLSFCHYYDRWGCNWYGWNCGNSFYWSCWWGNNWWWYDPIGYRWCYWYDGWWWWQNPDNVTDVYVYNNGEYVPSNQEQAQVSGQAPAMGSISQIRTFNSKDGTRAVKLAGDSNDAFLYDTTDSPAFQPKYLASGVKEAHFSNNTNGKPLQIMLILNDGSFEMYDADGNSVSGN